MAFLPSFLLPTKPLPKIEVNMTRYRAKAGLRIPMPDRNGLLVPDEGDGIQINELSNFYRNLIAEGSLVAVPADTAPSGAKAEGKK